MALPRDIQAGDVFPGCGTVVEVTHRKDWTRLYVDVGTGTVSFDVPATLVLLVQSQPAPSEAKPRKAASSIEHPRLPSQTMVPAQDPSRTNSPPNSDTGGSTEPPPTSAQRQSILDELTVEAERLGLFE